MAWRMFVLLLFGFCAVAALISWPLHLYPSQSVAWLETFLKQFQGTVVAITHDRYVAPVNLQQCPRLTE